MKRGLYALAGDSDTARAAACANLLLLPTTNVLNVYLGFRAVIDSSIALSLSVIELCELTTKFIEYSLTLCV